MKSMSNLSTLLQIAPRARPVIFALTIAIGVILAVSDSVLGQSTGVSTLAAPIGKPGSDPAHINPVLRFQFVGTGPLSPLSSIPPTPASAVNDPIFTSFSAQGELFVANRHGNVGGGVGSIARFTFDAAGNYFDNGTITGNSLEAVHGLAFNPNGELFAANFFNGKISRFRFDGAGNAIANGTINNGASNMGLAFSAGGELFVTHSSSIVTRYRFDAAGTAIPNGSFVVPGSSRLHGLAFNALGELFVGDIDTNRVFRFHFDGVGNPLANGSIFVSGGPIGVAFSSSGELFVSLHFSGGISRFLFDTGGNATANGFTPTDNLGGLAVLSKQVINVEIDIKPGTFPNSVNPRSNGVIPVAILSTPAFDATSVDPATISFGTAQALAVQSAQEDVDNDGDVDLVLHFNTQDTGIKCGDTLAKLTGETFGSDLIIGTDSLNTVGCKPLQVSVRDVGPEIGIAFGLEGFIINPQDQKSLLASTGRVGVFKSKDGGLNWSTSNAGLTDPLGLVANAANIRRDPSNPQTIYSPTATDGLYRSTNFGESWSSIGGLELVNPILSDCAVHPTSPNVIYALAQVAEHPDTPGPLFKSTDGGSTFVESGGLPDLDIATSVAVAPTTPNVVYVLDIGTFEGVYKSTDDGSSFTRLASSPSQPLTLFPHPAQANTLLLIANSGSTGLFRSTDGGATFVQVVAGLPAGKLNNTVAYDPSNPSIVYVGGMGGIFRSTDDGATFARFGRLDQDNLGFFGANAISIDPTNTKVIYVSTSKGNFKSVNGGNSFVAINRGWRATQVTYLTFDNQSSPSLYAGVLNTVGVLRTNNRGNNYEIVGEKLPDIQVGALAVSPGYRDFIVAATVSGIFRSTNGGQSWTQSAIDTGQTTFINSRVAIDPLSPTNVYAVTANAPFPGYYRSTDGGQTFARSNTGLIETRLGTLAIDPTSPNIVYVGAFNGNRGVFKSTNGGLSFSATGQTNGNISEIVIDPRNSQAIYIGTRAGVPRVRRSLNGGATFSTVDLGLTGNGVRGLVVDPLNPARLFVWVRSGGVFMSEDGADSWTVIDAGETLRRSKPGRGTMAIDPKNPNLIYLGSASVLEVEIKP